MAHFGLDLEFHVQNVSLFNIFPTKKIIEFQYLRSYDCSVQSIKNKTLVSGFIGDKM